MLHFKPKGQHSLCYGKLNVRLTNKIKQILNSDRSFFLIGKSILSFEVFMLPLISIYLVSI